MTVHLALIALQLILFTGLLIWLYWPIKITDED